MRFSNKIQDIAKSSIFIALSMFSSFLTSEIIPKIPFFNGRPDFWYAFAITGIFFIKNLDIKIIYIITLPFALMIIEISSFAGIYDYFLEVGFPLFFIFIFIPVSYVKNKKKLIILTIILIIIWNSIRFLGQSYAGYAIYKVNIIASFAYNSINCWSDLIVIIPLSFTILILKYKIDFKGVKNENN